MLLLLNRPSGIFSRSISSSAMVDCIVFISKMSETSSRTRASNFDSTSSTGAVASCIQFISYSSRKTKNNESRHLKPHSTYVLSKVKFDREEAPGLLHEVGTLAPLVARFLKILGTEELFGFLLAVEFLLLVAANVGSHCAKCQLRRHDRKTK